MRVDSKQLILRRCGGISWPLLAAALLLASCWLVPGAVAWGAEVADRGEADTTFHAELTTLAAKCDELGLEEQGEQTRSWFVPRDPRRHYWFLPPSTDSTLPPADAPRLVKLWHDKFSELRGTQAERLFAVARQQTLTGDEAGAYRLLHEVLHEDPNHAQARRILGYTAGERGWRSAARRPARRRNRTPHPQFGWAANQYWQVESEHFELTTNLNAHAGQQVAAYLERVHAVWQQLFYPYWSVPGRLAAQIQGEDRSLGPDRVFSVVLFDDRNEYVRQLSQAEPQIAVSVGYYSQNHKTAFFYAGDAAARTTWVHESTHQFFQESGTVAPLVGERGNFWVVEGVALYMESLIDRGLYVTTGGADADRLQFARFRKLTEGYYIPLAQLVQYGRQQVQKDADIRKLYSQAAGLTHFLLHSSEGRWMVPFTDYLKAVYRGVGQRQTLELEVAVPYAELDQGYQRFLNVTDAELAFVDPGVQSLCLGHTDVTDTGLAQVPECAELRWLDLSFTTISDAGLASFADAQAGPIESGKDTDYGRSVADGGPISLEELDLSQTAVTDEGLKNLSRLSRLKVLWLTGTQVTDQGLSALTSLRNLERLDVQSTAVTPAGVEQLRKRLPNLE